MRWLTSVALALVISAQTAMAQNVLPPHEWVLDARLTPPPSAVTLPATLQTGIAHKSHARQGFVHLVAGAMVGTMVGIIIQDGDRVSPCYQLEDEPMPCVGLVDADDEPIVLGAFLGAAAGLTIYLVRTLLPNTGIKNPG